MFRRLRITVFALTALAAAPAYSQEFVRLRSAIPDFDSDGFSADYAKGISEVVRADLFESGGFAMIDRRSFPENVDITLLPRFGSWTAINTRMLVIGNVKRSADQGIMVQFRVYDPRAQRQIHKGQLTTADPAEWENLAHRVAEDIRIGVTRQRL
jgi:Tol biopolymer transport system component